APTWQAGVAKTKITPEVPMWMAGYGSRAHPADGFISDLWAKALVLRDPEGNRGVVITLDLVGIDRELSLSLCKRLEQRFSLSRSQIAICTSHTHSGPVVGKNLGPMHYHVIPPDQQKLVESYAKRLEEQIEAIVGEAISRLAPAALTWDSGLSTFAVNRRNNAEANVPALRTAGQLKGPFDHDVPVLAVRNAEGKLISVLFGYACHATVLSLYQWCADYPGFAQSDLEMVYPDCVAMFWAGCGADQNPLPRREVELARTYGRKLATAVQQVLDRPMKPVTGTLKTQYREIDLPFDAIPNREQWVKESESTTNYVAARAKLMLAELDAGRTLPGTYPFPVASWNIGNEVQWVVLGGEVVVDYAIRIKQELAGNRTWVAGYANDVMAYIPSVRVLKEGGYEGGGSMPLYGQPTIWSPKLEQMILDEIHRQLVPQR
ncbi:MAG: hypothetical protein RIS70_1844, partial [Planctomycetota bacterium]